MNQHESLLFAMVSILAISTIIIIIILNVKSKLKQHNINEFVMFEQKTNDWLLPLGYIQSFKTNHQTLSKFEIHYESIKKDKIRVVCVMSIQHNTQHFYLSGMCFIANNNINVSSPIGVTLSTGQYPIGSTKLSQLKTTLTNTIKKIS